MTRSEEHAKVKEIADAIIDGEAQDKQLNELEVLLENPEARDYYLDYMDMNARLLLDASSSQELTINHFKQTQPDDLILNAEVVERRNYTPYLIALIILISLLSGLIIWHLSKEKNEISEQGFAKVLSADEVKNSKNEIISSGQFVNHQRYDIGKSLELVLNDGTKLSLGKGSIEFQSKNVIKLRNNLLSLSQQSSELTLDYLSFTVTSANATYQIQKAGQHYSISIKSGQLQLKSKYWQPIHYWPLDYINQNTADLSSNRLAFPKGNVTSTSEGINGAAKFTGGVDALLIPSSRQQAIGTGTFAANEGLSIEALVKPQWQFMEGVQYEVFRKDKDKNYRILLAFQNDFHKNEHSFPIYPGKETRLAFGLYLIGQDYHELEVVLDGKEGRPMLQDLVDGRLHHLVASYNAATGLKAIYINGKLCASHKYPPGTRILSGGPGIACIGNSPVNMNEPFTGVIDEVAFYNFAMPENEILTHYQNFRKGLNYFGYSPDAEPLANKERMIELKEGYQYKIDARTGLIDKVLEK